MIEPAYTYAEAAVLLPCRESWLRANTPKRLPHTKIGAGKSAVTFTESQLVEIRKMFEVAPVAAGAVAELRPIIRDVVTRRRAS